MEAKAAADNATLQAQVVNDMMPDAIKKTEDTLKRAQTLKGKVEGTEKWERNGNGNICRQRDTHPI